jgi:hypothetical protein
MTIDERLEWLTERQYALTMNLELVTKDIESLLDTAKQDGEIIRALTRIAEAHGQRGWSAQDDKQQ